jgi:predicted nucleic acid-binding protein
VSSVLVDTGLLRDYLRGDRRAQRSLAEHVHRSICVVTWLELLSSCPPGVLEETRSFLRTFERLSVSEGIADEALRLASEHPGLDLQRALIWACAIANRLAFLTTEPVPTGRASTGIIVPYRHKGITRRTS